MITARIQIEDGQILDTYEGWGFICMEEEHRLAPPEKKRDVSSYAEEPGEHVDPRTVDDVFDYTTKFLVETPNKDLRNANAKIAAFNAAIREKTAGSDVKRCKTVTLYDDRMRCKIVGIPEVVEEAKDFYRRQDGSAMDCVQFELTIHVSDPTKCDFNTLSPFERYDKRDLNVGVWYGRDATNGTIYQAQTADLSSMRTAVAVGDKVRLTTTGRANAKPYFVVDADGLVLYAYDSALELDGHDFISEWDGYLLVNCTASAADAFQLSVDRRGDTE